MHHYCTATGNIIAFRQDMLHVWRAILPEEAYKHSYIMHGLLAISALHKAHLIPSDRSTYLTLAAHHQSLELEEYTPQITKVSDETWKPLFSFASILIIYAALLPKRSGRGELQSPILDLLDLFSYRRGIQTVFEPFLIQIRQSCLAPLAYGVWVIQTEENTRYHHFLREGLEDSTRPSTSG